MIPCSWKETFGIECMTCGAQRSAGLFFSGHFLESIYLFPALLPLIFTVFFTIAHLIFKFRNGAKIIVISFAVSAILIVLNFAVKSITTYM